MGTVVGVRQGETPGGVKWLILQGTPPQTKRMLVPLHEVREAGGHLTVAYVRGYVQASPLVDDEGPLPEAQKRRLCMHYGVDYAPPGGRVDRGCGLCSRRRRERMRLSVESQDS